jgi:hypothetical protein
VPTEKAPSPERWEVILEQIRAQNHAAIEAVENLRSAVDRELQTADDDSRTRDSLLELAVRDLIESLARLEARITALENGGRS